LDLADCLPRHCILLAFIVLESPFPGMHQPNVFSSLLIPATSSNIGWPKAPDVTMSHLLPERYFLTPLLCVKEQ